MRRAKWTVNVMLREPETTIVHGFNSYQQARAALAVAELALQAGELIAYELLDAQGLCLVDSMWDTHQRFTRAVLPPGRYAWDEASDSLRPASLKSRAADATMRQLVTGGGGAAEGAPGSV
jgi:hypothetical protein